MNSNPRPPHISGRGSAQQQEQIAAATRQATLLTECRARQARRAAAGVLPTEEQITPELIAERLAALTEGTHFPAIADGPRTSLLMDVADVTGANGMRTFVATVREVDAPEGHREADVERLTALLGQAVQRLAGGDLTDVARYLLDAGVTL